MENIKEDEIVFKDWKKRNTPAYASSYFAMLSEIYDKHDSFGEDCAVQFAEDEMKDWIHIHNNKDSQSDYIIAKIHACDDYINGEDMFGECYGN